MILRAYLKEYKTCYFYFGGGFKFYFGDGPIKLDHCNNASHLFLTNSTIN
jgi:hypothetical protein